MKNALLAGTSLLAITIAISPVEAMTVTYSYTGGMQTFTTTKWGLYEIDLAGAQGGSNSILTPGGLGAVVHSRIFLPGGLTFGVLVGGAGQSGNFGGGGGGGTFITYSFGGGSYLPVLVAGGGGGAIGFQYGGPGLGNGYYAGNGGGATGGPGGGPGGYGGSGGYGGHAGYGGRGGGGGGGFYGDGYSAAGVGGSSWYNGGGGGESYAHSALGLNEGQGGFGGGGGAGYYAGGGGGGYSGGGGGGTFGGYGGGGNSYAFGGGNPGIWPLLQFVYGANSGDGWVTISDVPEPASIGLLGAGVAGLGAVRRRRQRVPA